MDQDMSTHLDDEQMLSKIDSMDMLGTIAEFSKQIQEAVALSQQTFIPDFIKIDNVVITGMGGSGIVGDIVSSLFWDKAEVPIVINKTYDLPKWAHKNTLTIFLSYSGDTEETISSFKTACQRKCKIISISSGGKLKELAIKRDLLHISIPPGFQPRAATGYLLFPLLFILKKNGIIKNTVESDIDEAESVVDELQKTINKSVPTKSNIAKQLALQINGTFPQMYGWNFYTPVALRWRTQFNENSKLIARADSVPESNHNDIVGWSANPELSKQATCILFRDKDEESIYMSQRLEFMKKLFSDVSKQVFEITPQGKSRLAKQMYSICLGDFISVYLAILREIDPTPIDAITELKNTLSCI